MEIDGHDYRINTDFRAWVAYSSALLEERPVQLKQLLRLAFPEEQPQNETAALEAVHAFLRCGEEAKEKKEEDKGEGRRPSPYSFQADAGAILAEFQQVYGIDLSTAEMHWWRFSALLRGLIGHSFSERVKYRVADLDKIKDSEVRRHWRAMKDAYALDDHGQPARKPQTLEEYNEMLLAQARGERW